MTAKKLMIELQKDITYPINIKQEIYDKLVKNTEYILKIGNDLKLLNNFFIEDKKVPNVCRYLFKKEKGKFQLKGLEGKRDFEKSKWLDKKIYHQKYLPSIVVILESPHQDEYTLDVEPIAPAQGVTGNNLCCYLEDILNKGIEEGKLDLGLEQYRVLIVNPVPFQTSLFHIHKQPLKGSYATLRNKIWKTLWENDQLYKRDFQKLIKKINPSIIINACTYDLRDKIKVELCPKVQSENDIYSKTKLQIGHPSSWNWKKNRIINTLCFLFLLLVLLQ